MREGKPIHALANREVWLAIDAADDSPSHRMEEGRGGVRRIQNQTVANKRPRLDGFGGQVTVARNRSFRLYGTHEPEVERAASCSRSSHPTACSKRFHAHRSARRRGDPDGADGPLLGIVHARPPGDPPKSLR